MSVQFLLDHPTDLSVYGFILSPVASRSKSIRLFSQFIKKSTRFFLKWLYYLYCNVDVKRTKKSDATSMLWLGIDTAKEKRLQPLLFRANFRPLPASTACVS